MFRGDASDLASRGHACIVIGNTAIGGVPILNAQVFAEQMSEIGLVVERVILREIPSKILPTTRDATTGRFASSEPIAIISTTKSTFSSATTG